MANPEKAKAQAKDSNTRWRLANPDAVRAMRHRRDMKRRQRKKESLSSFTKEDYQRIFAVNKCHICKKRFTETDPATLDHVIPLAYGGRDDLSNLAPAHRSCNAKKGAKVTFLI